MTTEVLDFDAAFEQVPVRIKNAAGVTENYILREFDGEQREEHLESVTARAEVDPKDPEKSRITNIKLMHADLICKCLFKVSDEGLQPVPASVVQAWPGRIQEALYERCSKLNGLGKKAEEDAKNDSPESGTGGSESRTA